MILYTLQTDPVLASIDRLGYAHCKARYIEEKYGEMAPIFLTAYRWLAKEGARYVAKPEGAELFYWAFGCPGDIERFAGSTLLTLDVPQGEALLFRMEAWKRVLQLTLLGDDGELRDFRRELAARGIAREQDILLTGFYPDLRAAVLASWQRLFRDQAEWQREEILEDIHLQAALWELRREWIVHRERIG